QSTDGTAGTDRMSPVRALDGLPPVVRIGQADPVRRRYEHRGERHQQFRPGARILRWIWRSLGHGDIPGLTDEPAELPVRDRARIYPEPAHRDLVRRGFLGIVIVRAHQEGRTGNPHHAVHGRPFPRAWSECAVPGGQLSSPAGDDLDLPSLPDTGIVVNPRDRLRPAGRRNPVEAIAQQVTERVVDLLVSALDVNELAARIDLNALLDRVDINTVLKQVDLNALLDQVDVNDLVSQVDMDALVERTDLGAVIARSSGGMGTEALDALRSQAVGLDQFVDRWVQRLLRRKEPAPLAPPALLPAQAQP